MTHGTDRRVSRTVEPASEPVAARARREPRKIWCHSPREKVRSFAYWAGNPFTETETVCGKMHHVIDHLFPRDRQITIS
jgi:hypothetical protein